MRRRSGLLSMLAGLVLIAAAPAPVADLSVQFEKAVARIKAAMLVNPPDALIEGERAAVAARRLADPVARRSAMATVDWLRGEANLRMDRVDEAAPLIARALSETEKIAPDTKLHGDVLLSSGGMYGMRTDVATALVNYQKAFIIFRGIGDSRSQSIALLSLASLYNDANENRIALKYLRQALEIYNGDAQLALSNHNNRGVILADLGRFDEAQRQFELALALARSLDSRLQRASILPNVARAYLKQGRLREADRALADGLRLVKSGEASLSRTHLESVAAQAAYQHGRLREAVRFIRATFDHVDLTTTPLWYRDAHRTALAVLTKTGDPAAALAHLMALKRIDDEAAKLASSLNTAMVAARFDFANQELRIAKLKADELRNTVEVAQQQTRVQRLFFLSIAAATLVIIVLLLVGLITIRRSRDKVRASAADLAVTNTALGKALAAKTEFLAMTSHEIRTPLNGILGMTQVMLADVTLSPAVRDRVEVVHGAGATMRALVDDILDMAKIETGNVTVERAPFDCCALISEASRLWQDQARAKGLRFAIDLGDCPAMIDGDAARVRQIVFNLLSNAIKFTAAGDIALTVSRAADGTSFDIRVTDTGIGIPADQIDTVFEPFRQADTTTTRRFGGTGLGLAICRSLARAMDGDVRVESVAAEGSTFVLTLPLRLSAVEEIASADEAGPVVLIVERNPITRAMLRALIEPHATRVVLAADAGDAAARMTEGHVSHVMVDEATLEAAGDATAGLRAIVAAAHDRAASVLLMWSGGARALLALGADRVVMKPVTGAALVNALFAPDAPACDYDPPLESRAA